MIKTNSAARKSENFGKYLLPLIILFYGCSGNSAQSGKKTSAEPYSNYWTPSTADSLQIQYSDYPPELSVKADIFALDLFEVSQASIEQLHAKGKRVICYLNTGSWEEYRPDAGAFPAEVIGKDYEGWPGEKWLDISSYELFADIMQARFDLAVEKGCDGIDADNMQNFEEDTGFDITPTDQLAYNIWLSDQAHQRDLSIGLKNDAGQAAELLTYFDWSLIEDCTVYDWCSMLLPFSEAAKPVFQLEYTDMNISLESFCVNSRENGFLGLLKHRQLNAWVEYCPQ